MSSPFSSALSSVKLSSASPAGAVPPAGPSPAVASRRSSSAARPCCSGPAARLSRRWRAGRPASRPCVRTPGRGTRNVCPFGVPGGTRSVTGGPAVRRHLDLRAERRLGEASPARSTVRLSPLPAEHRVRLDVDPDVQVAGLAAVLAGGALAGDPDPLPVGDARRGCAPGWCASSSPARCRCRRARVVDHQAAAAAGRARLGEPEAARLRLCWPVPWQAGQTCGTVPVLAPVPWQTGQAPRRSAAATPSRRRSRRRSGSVISVSTSAPRRGAARPRRRRGRRRCRRSTSPSRGRHRVAAEQVAQVEVDAAAAGAGRRRAPGTAAAEHRAGLVVLLALLLVGQHVVRFGDLLEALLGVGARPCWRRGGTSARACGRPS